MTHASNPKDHPEPVLSVLHYPSNKDYKLPRKNILVIGCIDLRLADNLVHFLHFDNLHNRYDHFTLAGTSLLCSGRHDLFTKVKYESLKYAKNVLFDHVEIAKDLHQIKDVYIVEHEDCGAYANFLDASKVDLSTPENERKWHRIFARELADALCQTQALNVHCFFIDLRGNVELLYTRMSGSPAGPE